jgi:putative addiction module component (TIGR02574 family)
VAAELEVRAVFLDIRRPQYKAYCMSSTELLNKAMELSADERAELARRLILSLDSAPADADADGAWDKEIERRLERLDRGEAKLVDWRESVERARKSLREGKGE